MEILIVTEADVSIGLGHLRRCIILAKEALNHDLDVTFYLIHSNIEAQNFLESKGFKLSEFTSIEEALTAKAYRAVVVDIRNDVTISDEANLLLGKQNVALIDDISERNNYAKYSFYTPAGDVEQYAKFGKSLEIYGGWNYLISNQDFKLDNQKKINELLINFGASEPFFLSEAILHKFGKYLEKYDCTLVLGPLVDKNRRGSISELGTQTGCKIIWNPTDFSEIVSASKLVIGTFGNLFYESILAGTPIISIYKNISEVKSLITDNYLQDLYFFDKSIFDSGSKPLESAYFTEAIEQTFLRIKQGYEFKFRNLDTSKGEMRIIEKILSEVTT